MSSFEQNWELNNGHMDILTDRFNNKLDIFKFFLTRRFGTGLGEF